MGGINITKDLPINLLKKYKVTPKWNFAKERVSDGHSEGETLAYSGPLDALSFVKHSIIHPDRQSDLS